MNRNYHPSRLFGLWRQTLRVDQPSELSVDQCRHRLVATFHNQKPSFREIPFWKVARKVIQVYGRIDGDRVTAAVVRRGPWSRGDLQTRREAMFEGKLIPDGSGCRLIGSIKPQPSRFFVAYYFGLDGLILVLLTYMTLFHEYEPDGFLLGLVAVLGVAAIGFLVALYVGIRWEVMSQKLVERLTTALTAGSDDSAGRPSSGLSDDY